uniref:CCHC-type domain-containing protein n=1 Tax=Davidia involucrata TaxID=16924 RepID=A0A5B7C7J8_DAVIN
MADDLYLHFHPYPTATALMDALNARFNTSSMASRMVLFRKYVEHRMPEDAPINHHILEMGVMAHDLQTAGVPVPDEMQAVVLMNSLPESWEDVVGGLIVHMNTEDLTLVNVSKRLGIMGDLKEWRARENEASTDKKSKKGLRGNCYTCGRPGHCQADCPNSELF